MNKSIERTTKTIALTAALFAGAAQTAGAESATPMSPRQVQATRLAAKITRELYDARNFPKGVAVPGILNGMVEITEPSIHNKVVLRNPIILEASHTAAQIDENNKLLDGTWVGIPVSNAKGQISISPLEIQMGKPKQPGENMSVHLQNQHDAILEGAGIYASTSTANANPSLVGFNIQGGENYPKVHITANGMR